MWKYTRVVSPKKPLKIRENWCVPVLCEKVSRETAAWVPFPVQVEGHEISDSLMEFFSESHEIMVVFPLRGASWGSPGPYQAEKTPAFFLRWTGSSRGICLALVLSQLAIACVAVHWSSFAMVPLGLECGSESWRMWFLWGDENICGDEHSKQRHWISKNCSFTKHPQKWWIKEPT